MTLAFITFDPHGLVFFATLGGCLVLLGLGHELCVRIAKSSGSPRDDHADDRRALARSALLCSYILSLVIFAPIAWLQFIAIIENVSESGQPGHKGPSGSRLGRDVAQFVLVMCFYPFFFYVGLTNGWKDAATEDDD